MFSSLYCAYFPFSRHFKILSAICFNLDQSKILSSFSELNTKEQNLRLFKFCERICGRQIKCTSQKLKFLFLKKKVGNIVEIEENADHHIFFPFSTMFSKVFYFRVIKCLDCVVKAQHSTTHSDFERTWVKIPSRTLRKKEKMQVTSIFSLSHNVFNPIKDKIHHFKNINFVVCKCFQFGPV